METMRNPRNLITSSYLSFKNVYCLWSMVCGLLFLTGCINTKGNVGNVQSYPIPTFEAQWIRNGEPIEFEGELWYPADSTENLQDSEILLMGEHRGIQFFIDKLDVRPYECLYTKYGKNQFRYFEKEKQP